MSTGAPDTRKTHVIRIVGTNKNGDVLQDMWVDVERMDIIKSVTQKPDVQWQGHQRKLKWMDDPAGDDYDPNGNPAREYVTLKLCDPENTDDVTDPDEWIPLPVIKVMKSFGGDGHGQGYQDKHLVFDTGDDSDSTTARQFEARRFVHYDTNIDDDAQAAFDDDPTLTAYVVQGEDYQIDPSTENDSQYVEQEVLSFYKASGNASPINMNNSDTNGQGKQIKLLNQYLIDMSQPAQGKITGSGGVNPPYRLDPFQNIINVNWGGTVIVVVNAAAYPFAGGPATSVPSYQILDESVVFLGSRPIKYSGSQGSPNAPAWAFKVNVNAAGAFINIHVPKNISGSNPNNAVTNDMTVSVFAYDKTNPSWSLDRALDGAQLIASSFFAGGVLMGTTHHITTDLPSQADPPGLLWSIYCTADNETVPLKIRRGAHRPVNTNSSLPNQMVQVYPLEKPHVIAPNGDFQIIAAGYLVGAYRLDSKGTGPSYGVGRNQLADGGGRIIGDPIGPQGIPGVLLYGSAWGQNLPNAGTNVNASGWYGVPFGDPPPLIAFDPVSTGGGLVGPF